MLKWQQVDVVGFDPGKSFRGPRSRLPREACKVDFAVDDHHNR